MKVVILAGGLPSRLTDELEKIPRPMLEIGERPLLWHIMKHYSAYGLNDFIICGGYKVNVIKDYFNNFYAYQSDICVDLSNNSVTILKNRTENWKVTVLDTGKESETAIRVRAAEKYIEEDTFIVTVGDCISDIPVNQMIEFHRKHNKAITVAVSKPTGRNHTIELSTENEYIGMNDRSDLNSGAWVNTGTYIFNKSVFPLLKDDEALESKLLVEMSGKKEVMVYKHAGFWTPVETDRNKIMLENLWLQNKAPWIHD